MSKPQVQCALGTIQELLINVRVEKRSRVGASLLGCTAEYCTLEIIDLSTELTYSLVTVRAVVDVFESQFKHLQLL